MGTKLISFGEVSFGSCPRIFEVLAIAPLTLYSANAPANAFNYPQNLIEIMSLNSAMRRFKVSLTDRDTFSKTIINLFSSQSES